MTSEVLLMNLEAVALGADSAVTISDSETFAVSQTGVEKIHIIDEAGPIAAMVYGGGRFAGLPWKSVLAQFRQGRTAGASVKATTEDLITFLANVDRNEALAGDADAEVQIFVLYIITFTLDFGDWLKSFGWEEKKPVSEATAKQALAFFRKEIELESGADGKSPQVPRPRIEEPPQLRAFLKGHLSETLQACLASVLDGSPYPQTQVAPLIELALQSLLIEWLPNHAWPFSTGMVVAGFGAGRAAPSMAVFEFLGSFGGLLKSRALGEATPRAGSQPVVAATFAQDEMTRAFLHGVMPQTEQTAQIITATVIFRTLNKALAQVAKVNGPLARKLGEDLDSLPIVAPHVGFGYARSERLDVATQKLWPVLSAANASILADYAAKFMELPVIEHELMREDSVARPIRILAMEPGRYVWKG